MGFLPLIIVRKKVLFQDLCEKNRNKSKKITKNNIFSVLMVIMVK